MTQARYFALIPAAGVGARMAAGCPKQYLSLAGRSILQHSVAAFLENDAIAHTFVVVSQDDAYIDGVYATAVPGLTVLRCGGATRKASVLNGLMAIRGRVEDADWVLVHDAARPGLSAGLINQLIGAVGDDPVGGLLALPVVDTVKRNDASGLHTISREGLWLAQTPQMFRMGLLLQALDQGGEVTDEAGAVEALGLSPVLVEGHPCNLKVTLPQDIRLTEMFLAYEKYSSWLRNDG